MRKSVVENKGERTVPSTLSTFEFERIYFYVSKKFGHKDKVCLDYGCGSGYGTNILSGAFLKVIGVDVSIDAIDFCVKSFPKRNLLFYPLNTEKRPFDEATFDLICSFQVLEHVSTEELQRYLNFIWEMLKAGGKAILTTPNSHNYYRGYSGNVHHVHEYSYAELVEVMDNYLPLGAYKIYFIKDVFSTRLSLRIRKYFGNAQWARLVSFILKRIIIPFELVAYSFCKGNLRLDENSFEKEFGSFYIELNKFM